MLRPLACRLRGIEAVPGYAANQQQDDDQDSEHEGIGAGNDAPGHRERLLGSSLMRDWQPLLRVNRPASHHALQPKRVPQSKVLSPEISERSRGNRNGKSG